MAQEHNRDQPAAIGLKRQAFSNFQQDRTRLVQRHRHGRGVLCYHPFSTTFTAGSLFVFLIYLLEWSIALALTIGRQYQLWRGHCTTLSHARSTQLQMAHELAQRRKQCLPPSAALQHTVARPPLLSQLPDNHLPFHSYSFRPRAGTQAPYGASTAPPRSSPKRCCCPANQLSQPSPASSLLLELFTLTLANN